MGHYYDCEHCGQEKGHAKSCPEYKIDPWRDGGICAQAWLKPRRGKQLLRKVSLEHIIVSECDGFGGVRRKYRVKFVRKTIYCGPSKDAAVRAFMEVVR